MYPNASSAKEEKANKAMVMVAIGMIFMSMVVAMIMPVVVVVIVIALVLGIVLLQGSGFRLPDGDLSDRL